MPAPLSVKKNNYTKNPKRSNVPTPQWLCHEIADLYPHARRVFDPCCGDGRLLLPFKERGVEVLGMDLAPKLKGALKQDFLEQSDVIEVDLVVCNPPFNLGVGKMLGSELFLRKIQEVCVPLGAPLEDLQIVLFCPMGFRLNQRQKSTRWRWLREQEQNGLRITSIMSLPLDVFDRVEFHSEVLFFNSPHLAPHLFPCAI